MSEISHESRALLEAACRERFSVVGAVGAWEKLEARIAELEQDRETLEKIRALYKKYYFIPGSAHLFTRAIEKMMGIGE